jgi:hypothetical protein
VPFFLQLFRLREGAAWRCVHVLRKARRAKNAGYLLGCDGSPKQPPGTAIRIRIRAATCGSRSRLRCVLVCLRGRSTQAAGPIVFIFLRHVTVLIVLVCCSRSLISDRAIFRSDDRVLLNGLGAYSFVVCPQCGPVPIQDTVVRIRDPIYPHHHRY